jgi:hypothetical protein
MIAAGLLEERAIYDDEGELVALFEPATERLLVYDAHRPGERR